VSLVCRLNSEFPSPIFDAVSKNDFAECRHLLVIDQDAHWINAERRHKKKILMHELKSSRPQDINKINDFTKINIVFAPQPLTLSRVDVVFLFSDYYP
jgi:hypothetical protein